MGQGVGRGSQASRGRGGRGGGYPFRINSLRLYCSRGLCNQMRVPLQSTVRLEYCGIWWSIPVGLDNGSRYISAPLQIPAFRQYQPHALHNPSQTHREPILKSSHPTAKPFSNLPTQPTCLPTPLPRLKCSESYQQLPTTQVRVVLRSRYVHDANVTAPPARTSPCQSPSYSLAPLGTILTGAHP